ncbi:alpha-glucuronidase family glycosyl hydrolase [Herbaspirillum sp. SJZ107]|uniref:alpha-glucuronidase family glycosyl hydrolase n=1 Tax=Herbaspirillum sp. SJZ107 TaxID=2572881 RepID=UPI0011513AAA|nr:alpha-glucuronidase family glycosyl hydrolase [Herbaspirillum sp. SJZ107]TQK11797.1 alpha-glucuronidase [Herbaspirillum sp. SJZ107]
MVQRYVMRRAAALSSSLSGLVLACLCLCLCITAGAADQPADEDGYRLWLRYAALPAARRAQVPAGRIASLAPDSPTVRAARAELQRGLDGLLDRPAGAADGNGVTDGGIVLARAADLPSDAAVQPRLRVLGTEGYLVERTRLRGHEVTLVAANTDIGLLYGSFAWLRALQAGTALPLASSPALPRRLLDHWDNLDRSVERGYAGESIWNWWELPGIVDPRYTDYARANASLGINGAVLNNVNAKAEVLGAPFIAKAAAVAAVLRPYGIRVYLSVRWSTPLELKQTRSADPLDPEVAAWWRSKADEIYRTIPDFGGFLVKANSEGQPGPQDYGRNHADGANMLARALAPHGGIVMWRAFVYNPASHPARAVDKNSDRAAQAYDQFKPLDGKFDANVIVQVKNGPIDFQPREPVHPLFGAMPATPLMMEFQITKEYLGFATHLAFLGPLFQEALRFDTRAGGRELTVAQALQGKPAGKVGGIAGVANIGSSRTWSGSDFDQANWYAFGRMAWDPLLDARAVAREWAQQTWSPVARVADPVVALMMRSREAVVDYMTPLGLHHMMGTGHHHGPAPWVDNLERPDWNPVYYHRAARDGIGFARGAAGSNALAQYAPEVARRFADPATTPPEFLLWFHHLPWTYRMPSGRSLWHELVAHYDRGVAEAAAMQAEWERVRPLVDTRRGADVAQRLARQCEEAQWWRDACLAYFQQVNGLPLPPGSRPPAHPLEDYRALAFPYAPGHG